MRVERHQRPHQTFELAQRHHVGTVRRRMVGIGMGFDEHAGDADGDRGTRQHRHEFALAARRSTLAAGLLHRMGGVEDHGRAGRARQDRQRAHVGDQRVVAERGAALGHQHIAVAGAGDLGDDIGHVPGRQELPLLDVDDLAGRRRRQQQIGLPAQERRDLQDIDGLRDLGALRGLVDIREHGQAERGADLGKDRQRLLQADPARRGCAGAVGLVERGLVDEPNAEPRGDLLQRSRHLERVRAALELARAGDDRDRQVIAEFDRTGADDRRGCNIGVQRIILFAGGPCRAAAGGSTLRRPRISGLRHGGCPLPPRDIDHFIAENAVGASI